MHGEPSWCFLYRKMIPALTAAGLRCIAPDLVGFGRSDKPTERAAYTYARHVEWMRAALFDALDLRDVTLVCQDWGGLIGLRLVGEHPDRFARGRTANTFLPTGEQPPGEAFLELAALLADGRGLRRRVHRRQRLPHRRLPPRWSTRTARRSPTTPTRPARASSRCWCRPRPTIRRPSANRKAWETLRAVDQAVPHRVLRPGRRSREAATVPFQARRAGLRRATAHDHRGRRPLPPGRLRRAARTRRRELDQRQLASVHRRHRAARRSPRHRADRPALRHRPVRPRSLRATPGARPRGVRRPRRPRRRRRARALREGCSATSPPRSAPTRAIFDEHDRVLLVRRVDDGKWGLVAGLGRRRTRHPSRPSCARSPRRSASSRASTGSSACSRARPASHGNPHSVVSVVYLCDAIGGELRAQPHEVREIVWRSIDDVARTGTTITRRSRAPRSRRTGGEQPADSPAVAASPDRAEPSLAEAVCLTLVAREPTHGWSIVKALAPDGEIGRVWSLSRPLTYRALGRAGRRGADRARRLGAGRGPAAHDLARDRRRAGARRAPGSGARFATRATCAPSSCSSSCWARPRAELARAQLAAFAPAFAGLQPGCSTPTRPTSSPAGGSSRPRRHAGSSSH